MGRGSAKLYAQRLVSPPGRTIATANVGSPRSAAPTPPPTLPLAARALALSPAPAPIGLEGGALPPLRRFPVHPPACPHPPRPHVRLGPPPATLATRSQRDPRRRRPRPGATAPPLRPARRDRADECRPPSKASRRTVSPDVIAVFANSGRSPPGAPMPTQGRRRAQASSRGQRRRHCDPPGQTGRR